jgi:hypothetical protein
MALEIIWSRRAEKGFDDIVAYRLSILKNRIELVNIRSSWRKPLK